MTSALLQCHNPFLEMRINLRAIVDNYKKIQNLTKTRVSSVVKADSYGLGTNPISKALYESGCQRFYVATLNEAFSLRKELPHQAEIYLFNGFTKNHIDFLDEQNITPVLTSLNQLALWQKNHESFDLNFDTGINRLSIPQSDLEKCLDQIDPSQVKTVMSHLACPDMPEYPLNKLQLDRFKEIAQHFPNSDKSLAASSGITLGPEFHFDEVRIGVYLYGFLSNPHPHPGLHLTPAIKARAQILEVKNVEKGVSIGYDATFISTKKMKIGTISAGYADGIPLSYTNKGVFMLNNHPVPIIGRVSMDLCVVDLSDVPAKLAKVGKWVDLIPDPVSFCKASKEAGCSPREILTRFGQRYNRIYEK